MICPFCSSDNEKDVQFCDNCGEELTPREKEVDTDDDKK